MGRFLEYCSRGDEVEAWRRFRGPDLIREDGAVRVRGGLEVQVGEVSSILLAVIVQADLLEVAHVGEDAVVIRADRVEGGGFGGLGGCHSGRRARARGIVFNDGLLVDHHLCILCE